MSEQHLPAQRSWRWSGLSAALQDGTLLPSGKAPALKPGSWISKASGQGRGPAIATACACTAMCRLKRAGPTSGGPELVLEGQVGGALRGGAPVDHDQQGGQVPLRQAPVLVAGGVVVHEGRLAPLGGVLHHLRGRQEAGVQLQTRPQSPPAIESARGPEGQLVAPMSC